MQVMDPKYIFAGNSPRIPLRMRISRIWRGYTDRNSILKTFVRENGIDATKNPVFPTKKYIVDSTYISNLSRHRDQYILDKCLEMKEAKSRLGKDISVVEAHISELLTEYNAVKARRDTLRRSISAKKNTTAIERINDASDLNTYETNLKNRMSEIEITKRELAAMRQIYDKNLVIFKNVFEKIDRKYEEELDKYLSSAGRGMNKIGFSKYDAILAEKPEEVSSAEREIINE